MKRHLTWIIAAAALALPGCNQADRILSAAQAEEQLSQQAEPKTAKQETPVGAPIVFFDIAGPDSKKQSGFYSSVFGWGIAPDGRFSTSVVSPLPGLLRTDPAGAAIYMGVDDVTAALAKVEANGGTIHAPRFEVPGVVVLGLFRDPAGNLMGLVEMKNGNVKIPKAQ